MKDLSFRKALKKWRRRYTVKRFDTLTIPSDNEISQIVDLIQYIPSQESRFDHFWLVLNPEDYEIKKWLLDNVFYHDNLEEGREYMIQILTAPYVLLAVQFGNETSILDLKRNIGIHVGCILAEALSLNLDVATIGCTTGLLGEDKGNKIREFNRIIKENYSDRLKEVFGKFHRFNFEDEDLFHLDMAVCIGKGEKLVPVLSRKKVFSEYEGYTYFPGQKRKKIKNVIFNKR